MCAKLQIEVALVEYDLDVTFISGVSLGLEIVDLGDDFVVSDIDWAIVLDVFIIRFTLFKLKQ